MSLIVDGNNVMGQIPGWHRDRARARRDLVAKLTAYARVRKKPITVVFDGLPDQLLPESSRRRGVRVLFARAGSDADSRILELVEEAKDPGGLTVVTSDRNLARAIRVAGAKVIRSGQFRGELDETLELDSEAEPEEDSGDLSQWMRYFGALPEDDEP